MDLDKMLIVNSKRCIGCRLCELACSYKHSGIFRPSVSRIKVKLFSKEGISVPIVCLQCKECYCIDACKSEAIHKNQQTGAIEINLPKCTGCKACLIACPFGGMSYDGDLNKAIVCDLCHGDPECIKYCFAKAIEFVDIDSVTFVRADDYIKAIKRSFFE